MAYAAVTCLRSTIRRLQNCSHISVAASIRTNLELAYEELGSLQKVLKRSGGSRSSYGSRLSALDGEIIGVVQELEDSLEFHELNSLSQSYGDAKLISDISYCVETVKKMKEDYSEELSKSLLEADAAADDDDDEEEEEEEEDDCDDDDEEVNDYDDDDDDDDKEEEADYFSSNRVGLSDQFNQIKWRLVQKQDSTFSTYVFSIAGMAGIGKTDLAKKIFDDPFISKRFECRAFVRVGQNYQLEELKQAILAQLNPHNDETENEHLEEYLDNKRYLIVLDDVWDLGFWNQYFKKRRGDKAAKGSRILLTTRIEKIPMSVGRASYFYMPFLNNEECWDLLCEKVFGGMLCPSELESAGRKIANKCDGLPLMVVTVADILSTAERTQDYWNEAALKRSLVFEDAYDRILPVLYPSYYNLPQHVKACFLYMGAFAHGFEIPRSKLVNLWCTEGFLEPNDSTPLTSFASECFDRLNFDHIVVPAGHLSSDGQNYQACSLHSVFRHLCKKELNTNEFLHIIDGYDDVSAQGKNSRRISIYNAVLLSYKRVYKSMDSSPTARSLLCSGPYHQYQVPINFNLRLLRVCDALTIRFYEFPSEVLELVQLRYFAITCNKNLPPSISKLWKLEYLIVHQHLSIISTLAESYVPVEIWDLQELRNLQLIGRNLPNPPTDVVLQHLVKLLDVGTSSCTVGVLTSLPSLKKLRVQIRLTPNLVEPLSYLPNISQFNELKSFQCVIVNPILTSEIVAEPSISFSSSSITKLTLSGLGYPWKFLNKFVTLPHLQVLKLLSYAFRGEKWEVEEEGFLKLQCLSIEESDLVQWRVGEGAFPLLSHLTLEYCYKLKELPKISSLVRIELVDCNPVAVSCAEEMDCRVSSLWDDERDPQNYVSAIYDITIY